MALDLQGLRSRVLCQVLSSCVVVAVVGQQDTTSAPRVVPSVPVQQNHEVANVQTATFRGTNGSVIDLPLGAIKDIRQDLYTLNVCTKEIAHYCSHIEPGEARILKCLWEVKSASDFGYPCAHRIDILTKLAAKDYRLDYRLHKHCGAEINVSCAKEKAKVDGLSLKQVLSAKEGNSNSGLVIQCLKERYMKLRSDDCKEEVRRVVRLQSRSALADHVLIRKCGSEMKTFCNQTHAGRIHHCLRKNIKALSAGCKAVEVLQGSLESMDIRMKFSVHRTCKTAIRDYCKDTILGQGAVFDCLHDAMTKDNFPTPCKNAIENDLKASNRDWRLKYGVSMRCLNDVQRLCEDRMIEGGGAVLTCLKQKHKKVKSDACHQEIAKYVRQGALNIKMAPKTSQACTEDVQQYCPDEIPGNSRVHQCLLSNKEVISAACAEAEFEDLAIQSSDIRAHAVAMKVCKADMVKLCPDTSMQNGAMWQCLEDKKPKGMLSSSCEKVLVAQMKLKHSEFHLNPQLSQDCKVDAEKLCSYELSAANTKDFTSNGNLITCLIEHKGKVTDPRCKHGLLRKQVQRIQHVSLNPAVGAACEDDINNFCSEAKGKGRGLVHKCLQDHVSKLSELCMRITHRNIAMASRDIRVNVNLERSCKEPYTLFCKDVEPGEGRIIKCLMKSLYSNEMPRQCRDALVDEMRTKAIHLDFNPGLKSACEKDLVRLYDTKVCNISELDSFIPRGAQITCLTDNLAAIKAEDCKSAVRSKLELQSQDLRAKPGFEHHCHDDAQRLCSGVEFAAGKLNRCLRRHLNNITNPSCKRMMRKVNAIESQSASLNFRVKKACTNEKSVFCPEVLVGESRMLLCLLISKDKEGFGNQCRTALVGTEASKSKLVAAAKNRTEAGVSQSGLQDLKNFFESNRGIIEKHGGLVVTGAVSLSAVLATLISYCLFRQRCAKTGYAVVVPRDLES